MGQNKLMEITGVVSKLLGCSELVLKKLGTGKNWCLSRRKVKRMVRAGVMRVIGESRIVWRS